MHQPHHHLSSLPPPMGLRWHGDHATMSVPVSPNATRVEVCVFDQFGRERSHPMGHHLGGTWWDAISGDDIAPGDRYGIRVDGPDHDRSKLLFDPWALAFEGTVDWQGGARSLLGRNGSDSAPFVPRSIVVDTTRSADPRSSAPNTSWSDTVIYEVHVKGATKLHPDIAPHERGTYRGFRHPAFIAHLKRLGVTAVELLPIQHHTSEPHLAPLGLTNYWGYNTVGFLAPHRGYATVPTAEDSSLAHQVDEFADMVRELHDHGIEVILDIVLNHSCEGRSGIVSWRGLDPHGWYHDHDTTGCGNTFDLTYPPMLQLALDSLRWWVTYYGVDGFRFDLSTALGRLRNDGFTSRAPFFQAIAQDPVLSQVKLIAEPWDVGYGGYQLGNHPPGWAEWNDRFRDTMRDHWNGTLVARGDVAAVIAGSRERFGGHDRAPWTSVNFVTAHDGFTLLDLVSYQHKHNEANGEGNADGTGHNRSVNHGVEGTATDPAVIAARRRHRLNLLASLLLSFGTPMLVAGDELGRTQEGNNNAYCQDNALSWLNWSAADDSLIDATADLIALRASMRACFGNDWLTETNARWFDSGGVPMSVEAWQDPGGTGLSLLIQQDDTVVLVFHEDDAPATHVLPALDRGGAWVVLHQTDGAARSECLDGIVHFDGPTVLAARWHEDRLNDAGKGDR